MTVVQPTMTTLSLAEYEEFGRANVCRVEATFLTLLLALAGDATQIAAAIRGRAQALEEKGATS